MVDFLKAFPFVSMEDYRWGLSVPMIRLMLADHTRVEYLSKKEAERAKAVTINSAEQLLTDLGYPAMGNNEKNNNI
jgi:hypothetical protein